MMLEAWIVIVAALAPPVVAAALLAVGWLLMRRKIQRDTRRELADFLQRFPARCPVCAFWRWGRQYGVDYTPAPPLHQRCPEGRS